jgi:hypothetical protein
MHSRYRKITNDIQDKQQFDVVLQQIHHRLAGKRAEEEVRRFPD